jgi:hypothetical protein
VLTMLKELEGRTRRKGWHMSEAASGGRKLLIDGAIRDADGLSELGLPKRKLVSSTRP